MFPYITAGITPVQYNACATYTRTFLAITTIIPANPNVRIPYCIRLRARSTRIAISAIVNMQPATYWIAGIVVVLKPCSMVNTGAEGINEVNSITGYPINRMPNKIIINLPISRAITEIFIKRVSLIVNNYRVRCNYSICAAWFFVSTLSIIRSIVPVSEIMNVLRRVPSVTLPYIFFSPHAPKALSISVEGSDSRVKGREYFSLNLVCDAALSLLTP